MKRYTDRNGKAHSVEITLAHRRQIRDQMEIDLVKCAHDDAALRHMLDELSGEDDQLWEMLSIIESIPVADLLAAADAQTIDDAGAALLGAIIDFFPSRSPLRAPLQRLQERVKETQGEAIAVAQAALMELVESLDIGSALETAQAPMSG